MSRPGRLCTGRCVVLTSLGWSSVSVVGTMSSREKERVECR